MAVTSREAKTAAVDQWCRQASWKQKWKQDMVKWWYRKSLWTNWRESKTVSAWALPLWALCDLKPCDHSPFLLSFLGRPCINLVPTHIDGPKLLNRRLLNHKNNSSFCWVPSLMNQLLKQIETNLFLKFLISFFLPQSKTYIYTHTHTPSGSAWNALLPAFTYFA